MGGTQPVEVREMVDSSPLLRARRLVALRARLAADGYLLLRGLIPRSLVHRARSRIQKHLRRLRATEGPTPSLLRHQEVAHDPAVLAVMEAPAIPTLLRSVFPPTCGGDRWVTLDFKWLRAVPTGQFTGVHTDATYFGDAAPSLHTVWIPFGDLPLAQGPMMVATHYHHGAAFRGVRRAYGGRTAGADGTDSGWYADSAAALNRIADAGWQSAAMSMGDVVLLPPGTMHMTACNTTPHLRLSADTRWHRASESLGDRFPCSPTLQP